MVQHYTHRKLDDSMRAMMAIDWLAREEESPGVVATQLQQVDSRSRSRSRSFVSGDLRVGRCPAGG